LALSLSGLCGFILYMYELADLEYLVQPGWLRGVTLAPEDYTWIPAGHLIRGTGSTYALGQISYTVTRLPCLAAPAGVHVCM
jgi:hypothetical protein